MSFAEKHPKLMEWVRKGGLFLLFSYFVTFLKALLLMFLPDLFRVMVGDAVWLWPDIPVTLFGMNLNLSIIGNPLAEVDGVICFTDRFHYQAWKALADRLGIYFDEKINDRLRGISRMASLDIILERATKEYTQEGRKPSPPRRTILTGSC